MAGKKGKLDSEQVAAAAEACFERFGVHRTSLGDVAKELGVARQTIYNVFESRPALLKFVANQRIERLGKLLQPDFDAFDDLEQALVQGSLLSIELAQSDELISELFENREDQSFVHFLFHGSTSIHDIMSRLLGPLIDKARDEGRVHDGLTNESIVQWVRNVHALAALRTDYGREDRERMLTDYLVRSILR